MSEKFKYKTIADYSYDWETWEDENGILQYVSPSCERISGYSNQEFLNNPSLFESIILNKEGLYLGYRANNRDITAYKNSIETIIKNELQFERIIDSLPFSLSIITLDGTVLYVNPKGTKQEFRIVRKDKEIRWIESDGIKIDWNGGYASLQFAIDITERKSKEEQILYLSYYDQLTGLYNRRFYEEELRRLDTKRNLPMTLVMADVNGLKLTNDAFGHLAGDKLLKAIADIIKKELRSDDILARIGGDEFVLVLPKTDSLETQLIIDRLRDKISKTVIDKISASVSFGYETKKEESEDMEKIFAQAEDYMYRRKLLESGSMKSEMITLITRSLYERDKDEQSHSKRVAELCKRTAEAMNFEGNQIGEIFILGMLHDIGKIGINQNILNSINPPDEKQWKEIKKHPEIGYHILKSVSEFSHIAEYVLCHHERPDGKGYPRGLKNKDIPIEARILAIAESYDSMTHQHYKKPISISNAIDELRLNSGTKFDKEIVGIFIEKVIDSRLLI